MGVIATAACGIAIALTLLAHAQTVVQPLAIDLDDDERDEAGRDDDDR